MNVLTKAQFSKSPGASHFSSGEGLEEHPALIPIHFNDITKER